MKKLVIICCKLKIISAVLSSEKEIAHNGASIIRIIYFNSVTMLVFINIFIFINFLKKIRHRTHCIGIIF